MRPCIAKWFSLPERPVSFIYFLFLANISCFFSGAMKYSQHETAYFLTTCLLCDYCLFTPQSWYSRCPGINVIVWSVKCKISIRWHSFMSLSNPDGAIFYSAWFKYPSLWICLQLNHSVNVQQPEKKPVFWNQWDTKQGELLTPGETTPDFDCKWYYTSVRAQSPTSKQSNNTTVTAFCPVWENQECFECCRVNLLFGYTTVMAFLWRYTVWNAANQVKNGERARGPIKSALWETPDVRRDREKQEESLSEIGLGQHGVVISTPLRCISVNLFKDKELLCCEKKAYCVESGVWTAAIRFICKCWQMKT